jgi:hypothetical protein
MKMLNSRKAILIPETLKIIIAVICIVLLIYLAVSLYGIFTSKLQLEQARATLNAVIGKINSLEKSGDTLTYLITGPSAWNIFYYDNFDTLSAGGCSGKTCICACPEFKTEEELPINPAGCIRLGGICQSVIAIKFDSTCEFIFTKRISIFTQSFDILKKTANCLQLGDQPTQVSFQNSSGVIRFIHEDISDISEETNQEISALLNFKEDKTSKSISELISDFLKLYPANPPTQEPSQEMKTVISSIKTAEKKFVISLDKKYGILKIVQKNPEKTIVTIGDTAYEDNIAVIWGLTDKYEFKYNNVDYELSFKTAN